MLFNSVFVIHNSYILLSTRRGYGYHLNSRYFNAPLIFLRAAKLTII